MIQEIVIENYKSIQKLTLHPGRITVLIGENGGGKSNILEAIALSAAAYADKLDNEFLVSRGIRVTEPPLMRAAFVTENVRQAIKVALQGYHLTKETALYFVLQNDNSLYSSWTMDNTLMPLVFDDEKVRTHQQKSKDFSDYLKNYEAGHEHKKATQSFENFFKEVFKDRVDIFYLNEFLIYSPENATLRIFEKEGQIQPLGINGEGLFKLLTFLSVDENKEKLQEIKEKLQLIDCFVDFVVPQGHFAGERHLQIKDKYLAEELAYCNQKSSNEGFLFLLFYFTLFISPNTPQFFAIDNLEASLNPKLCSRLMTELVNLAKKYDRQVIFTTHNPAVLDGLDLGDDEQRLFVIHRNHSGQTKARRILKVESLPGQEPVRLAEAFLRGYLDGLP